MMEADVPSHLSRSALSVRLISLELHGFKSFADAQKLTFPGLSLIHISEPTRPY